MKIKVVDWPEYDLEDLKSRLDLRLLVTPEIPLRGDRPTRRLCFWHAEKDGSLYVYPNGLHCFGCGQHMDALDFLAWQEKLDVRADFARLVELLAEYVGGASLKLPPVPVVVPKDLRPLDRKVAEYWHGRLGEKITWFRGRGLEDWLIRQERLGYERRAYVIPVWSATGELLTLRYRRDDTLGQTGAKYWGITDRNEVLLYNARALRYVSDWGFVVICEGELDALLLFQHGLPAVSATNGSGAFEGRLVSQVLAAYPDKVIVAYDQDAPGRLNGVRVARLFGLRGRVASWPVELGKDPTEVLQQLPVADFVWRLQQATEPVRLEPVKEVKGGFWR